MLTPRFLEHPSALGWRDPSHLCPTDNDLSPDASQPAVLLKDTFPVGILGAVFQNSDFTEKVPPGSPDYGEPLADVLLWMLPVLSHPLSPSAPSLGLLEQRGLVGYKERMPWSM